MSLLLGKTLAGISRPEGSQVTRAEGRCLAGSPILTDCNLSRSNRGLLMTDTPPIPPLKQPVPKLLASQVTLLFQCSTIATPPGRSLGAKEDLQFPTRRSHSPVEHSRAETEYWCFICCIYCIVRSGVQGLPAVVILYSGWA